MTLLNCDIKEYAKKLNIKRITVVCVFVAVLLLNILLTVLRNDQTHVAFLTINIISDIACGWFIIAFYFFAIASQSKLLKLVSADESLKQKITGTVTEISRFAQTVSKFRCVSVTVVNGDEKRTVFVAEGGGISLEKDMSYLLTTAENIVIFAEVQK